MTEVITCRGVAAPRCEKAVTNDTLGVGGLCDSEGEVCESGFVTTVME